MPKRFARRRNKTITQSLLVFVGLVVATLLISGLKYNFDLRNKAATFEALGQQQDRVRHDARTRVASLNDQVIPLLVSKQNDPNILEERKKVLIELARTNPQAFFDMTLPADVQARVPADQRDTLEQESELEGTLEVLFVDDFENKKGQQIFSLKTRGGKRVEIIPTDDSLSKLPSGTSVRLKGRTLDDIMVVYPEGHASLKTARNVSALQAVPTTTPAVTGTRKVLVVPFGFQDRTEEIKPEDLTQAIFSQTYSTANFYKENSAGQLSIVGEVVPFMRINYPYTAGCGPLNWSDVADAELINKGINLGSYDHVVYVNTTHFDCSFGGIGELPGRRTWINGGGSSQNTSYVVAHELGHNFSLHHAASLTCFDSAGKIVPLSHNCTSIEYGDPFEVMGWNYFSLSNYNKYKLGWLPQNQVLTVTKSGSYKLFNHLGSTSDYKLIRVPREQNKQGTIADYLYLENRKAFGVFDNFPTYMKQGVLIREAIAPETSMLSRTKLIDMTPGNDTYTSILAKGKTLKDPTWGIKITTKDQSTKYSNLKFELSAPICTPLNPSLFAPSTLWLPVNSSVSTDVRVYNNDSLYCGPSTYSLKFTVPPGWQGQPSEAVQTTVEPGTYTLNDLRFFIPADADTTKTYPLTLEVVNTANTAQRAQWTIEVHPYNLTPTPSDSPSPVPSPVPSATPTPSPFPTPSSGL